MDFEKNSQILKALAHPIRLKMAEMLMDDECCVTDVTNALGISQSTSSQHLGILKNAGIVFPEKYGTKTCYFVNNEMVKKLILLLKEST
ncbi:MAG: winged helix-turn-helix transcriptional regulator [Desulfuromusa sp.]|nr:winged helix-turn-helix transcriptional regulator [Desulfuromusa sp.]